MERAQLIAYSLVGTLAVAAMGAGIWLELDWTFTAGLFLNFITQLIEDPDMGRRRIGCRGNGCLRAWATFGGILTVMLLGGWIFFHAGHEAWHIFSVAMVLAMAVAWLLDLRKKWQRRSQA